MSERKKGKAPAKKNTIPPVKAKPVKGKPYFTPEEIEKLLPKKKEEKK